MGPPLVSLLWPPRHRRKEPTFLLLQHHYPRPNDIDSLVGLVECTHFAISAIAIVPVHWLLSHRDVSYVLRPPNLVTILPIVEQSSFFLFTTSSVREVGRLLDEGSERREDRRDHS